MLAGKAELYEFDYHGVKEFGHEKLLCQNINQ